MHANDEAHKQIQKLYGDKGIRDTGTQAHRIRDCAQRRRKNYELLSFILPFFLIMRRYQTIAMHEYTLSSCRQFRPLVVTIRAELVPWWCKKCEISWTNIQKHKHTHTPTNTADKSNNPHATFP